LRQPRTLLPVERQRGTRKHCRQECMACRTHAPHVSVQRLVAEVLHRLACQALADLPPLSTGGMASGPASCKLLAGCMDKSSALPMSPVRVDPHARDASVVCTSFTATFALLQRGEGEGSVDVSAPGSMGVTELCCTQVSTLICRSPRARGLTRQGHRS